MEPVFGKIGKKKKKRKRKNPDTSPSLPVGTSSSSLPVAIEPAAVEKKKKKKRSKKSKTCDTSSSLPVDTGTSSSLPVGIDTSSSFPIELLCSYTSDRIEECAMPRRDGSCSMSNTQRASLNKDVTFLFFENFDRLSDLLQRLNDLDHPNIPKVHAALDEPEPTLVVDRIASVPVKKWLHEAGRWGMWTVDSTGSQYTELEEKHKKVFRCISRTLAYLHTRQLCHGNLLEGIWVTEPTENDVRVSLANFDTSIDFRRGFMKDLEDLRSLVDIAVEKHSENMKLKGKCLTGPAALKAFYTLYGQVEQHKNDFDAMRELAIFVYWAPIFHNWEDRRDFIRIVEKFSVQEFEVFEKLVILDRGKQCAIPQMKNWMTRMDRMGEDNPLKKLYNKSGDSSTYKASGGIYWLHRCALHHYAADEDRDFDQAAMEDLFVEFPDALPAIFEKLVQTFCLKKVKGFGKKLWLYFKDGLFCAWG